ncbi:hypothetical protein HZF05_11575 [Sphingomonas sp. CGMCC 1.13654]|uniref:Uncharacterized protein n=1 Tax=Sphingomonas chungangi TaxID=2683589 RepID=A0A838L9C9_9SPHN|nr:hypothetical protein [Sphingomonas chungangi]MBA2934736.1 hypothetical protein [Sphingomonas chungangi]MVW58047.1 hypothetical protein [Sphingomonas chungangi]
MQVSDSLEVGIGLSFIFFLSSLVLTSVHEMIETVLKARGSNLYNGIMEMFSDPAKGKDGLQEAKAVYQHPLIRGLMRGDVAQPGFNMKDLPSYLPSRNFVLALMDQAAQGKLAAPDAMARTAPTSLQPLQQLRMMAEGIANDQVRGALVQAVDVANGDIAAAQDHLEKWFDGAMDRVSGWYKRRSQRIIFGLGLVMAVALNVNTLTIADSLSKSASLRQAVVAQAEDAAKNCTTAADCSKADPTTALDKTSVPIGWNDARLTTVKDVVCQSHIMDIILIVAGFLLTAFAVTLGAPFWFDVLNRLMVIRATVKPTEKSKDEASQDPQPGSSGTVAVTVVPPPPAPDSAASGAVGQIDTNIYLAPPTAVERLFEDDEGEPKEGWPAPGAAQGGQ